MDMFLNKIQRKSGTMYFNFYKIISDEIPTSRGIWYSSIFRS